MGTVVGIDAIYVRADDWRGLAAWYEKYLGVAFSMDYCDGGSWAELDTAVSGVDRRGTAGKALDFFICPKAGIDSHVMISFVVEDFDAVLARLIAGGAICDVKSDGANPPFAFLQDPAGNSIRIVEKADPTRFPE